MSGVRLERRSHFSLTRPDDYRDIQIERHRVKAGMTQPKATYGAVSRLLRELSGGVSGRMVCMGTRNNHERDCLAGFLPGVSVKSLDISPKSQADFIMDFTALPEDWAGSWDVLYSNSIDHSFDATATFDAWLRVVRVGGHMVLGFTYGDVTSASDICAFHPEDVEAFLSGREDVTLLGRQRDAIGVGEHWFIRRVS